LVPLLLLETRLKLEFGGVKLNWKLEAVLSRINEVSSLVSSHPWVCVFDYVRQHNYFSFHDYEIRLENPLYHSWSKAVKCCHAKCYELFICVSGRSGYLRMLGIEVFTLKMWFCTSGPMNARLSVHGSLKRAKRREDSSVRSPFT